MVLGKMLVEAKAMPEELVLVVEWVWEQWCMRVALKVVEGSLMLNGAIAMMVCQQMTSDI